VGSGKPACFSPLRLIAHAVIPFDSPLIRPPLLSNAAPLFPPQDGRVASGESKDRWSTNRTYGAAAFDSVYSLGVLPHTRVQVACFCENLVPTSNREQKLFIAIYNDQGKRNRRCRSVPNAIIALSSDPPFLVLWPQFLQMWLETLLNTRSAGRPFHSFRIKRPFEEWSLCTTSGLVRAAIPFEVARPEEYLRSFSERGFYLVRMTTQRRSRVQLVSFFMSVRATQRRSRGDLCKHPICLVPAFGKIHAGPFIFR